MGVEQNKKVEQAVIVAVSLPKLENDEKITPASAKDTQKEMVLVGKK